MEGSCVVRLGVIFVLLQAFSLALSEDSLCSPGFHSEPVTFKVGEAELKPGRRLGKVFFDDCSGRTLHLFDSSDKRFTVGLDGTLKVRRGLTVHGGCKTFAVHAWDFKGKKHTVMVHVEHEPRSSQGPVTQGTPLDIQMDIPVLMFPRSSTGLRRRKRDWVIPPINTPENDRGPFPKNLVQIRSSNDKEAKVTYKITGEGADREPKGLFTVAKTTGYLRITQPLDREAKAKYTLQAHAEIEGGGEAEEPMNITVNVIDMNDNHPIFNQNPFVGEVPEASDIGFQFMTVTATDADEPGNMHSEIKYIIVGQDPLLPSGDLFRINPVNGGIRVNSANLDREKYPKYTLLIEAADMMGEGRPVTGTAVITVTDSNDNAPKFEQAEYTGTVPENKVGAVVAKMTVTDNDDVNTPAWRTKYSIVRGDKDGKFNVSTGPSQEGIVTTIKPLDFESTDKYTLLVSVVNEVSFSVPLPTSTATLIITVTDVNEAPVFRPAEKIVSKPEDLAVGSELVLYTAIDPDTARKQKVLYKTGSDPAGWLAVNKDTGMINVKSPMDRESVFMRDGKYRALILAIDDDDIPATGTGTLVIDLEDVNDNAPTIEDRAFRICNREAPPVELTVTDKDGPGFAAPYRVELQGDGKNNWTARMNATKTGIILTPLTVLEQGDYNVVLRVFDNQNLGQDNSVQASVCDCKGGEVKCVEKAIGGFGLSGVLGILGAILGLLLLVLLLLLFARRRSGKTKDVPLLEEEIRDNIYYYDEEGGGEDDQDYDLSVLHRGLDNRPDVFRNDVVPTFMPAPQYRPRPANPDEIGNFIDDNMKAADNDPTAPPYDSLLVFDYEGGGSEAGSLSSLNSSSSGADQDYNFLNEWGPRFKKLADMYGGGED